MKPLLHFTKKCAGLLSVFLLVASFSASAQKKSVYDVIPGSGPKRTHSSKNDGIFGSRKTDHRRNTYPVYDHKRKDLPPGQAKKIYGGSAKDYAPGQVKKRHHYKDRDRDHDENDQGDNDQGENKHHEKHGKDH